MKKIAIIQSNYIPWKGYFDMIAAVDELIIYDDMQFTKNDWRNRNKIKTPQGVKWLTIPVGQDIGRRIRDVELINSFWQVKHWKTLESNYRRAPYFSEVSAWLRLLYMEESYTHLSQVNFKMIESICAYLGITTKISRSWEYQLIEGKTERVVDLCMQAGGVEYVSGPAAKNYIDESLFSERGIKLTWFDYSGYVEYPQLWSGFTHEVSVLDLLFNCGKSARYHLKSFSGYQVID